MRPLLVIHLRAQTTHSILDTFGKWLPLMTVLPGESHGQRSLVDSQRVGQDWVTNTFCGYYGGSTPTGLLNNCPMSLILSQDPLPCRIRWRSDSLQEGAVRPRVVLGNLVLFRLAEPQNWGGKSSLGLQKRNIMEELHEMLVKGKEKMPTH